MAFQDEHIAGALLDAAVDGGSWQSALLDLAGACKAQVGSMILVDKTAGRGTGFCLGVPEKWSSAFVRREARHVAYGAHLVQPGAVFTDRMVIGRRDFERSGFFEMWARPSGQTDYAGVAVLNDSRRFVFVGLARGPRRGAFDSDELETLERLRPHIARAARVWVALGAAEEARRTIEAAFDHIAHAVFLTDGDAKVRFFNDAAAELMVHNARLTSRAERLCCSSESETAELRALIKAASRGGAESAGRMKLAASNGADPLTLLVAPLSATKERAAPLAEVMVIAVGPGASASQTAKQFRSYFGLTRVEALLATHIVKGSGLKAAALALNIAPTTARTHLNRIFEKTGARNQAALAALLSTGAVLTAGAPVKSSD